MAHRIPNLQLATFGNRNSIKVMVPGLYDPTRKNPNLSQEEGAIFYEKGLLPTMQELEEDTLLASEWPPTYQDEMWRARKASGQFSFTTKILRKEQVPRFGRLLIRKLRHAGVRWAKGLCFLHQIRGVKAATIHDATISDPLFDDGYEAEDEPCYSEFLERNHVIEHRMKEHSWYVDVGLEVKSLDGHSLVLRTDHHFHAVMLAFGADQNIARRLTSFNNPMYARDMVVGMPGVAGFRIEPGVTMGGDFQVKYGQGYTTDKTHTYLHDKGHVAKRLSLEKVLAMKKGEVSTYCNSLHNLYMNAGAGHPSNVRLEVRVPISQAHRALQNIDEEALRSCILAFNNVEWW